MGGDHPISHAPHTIDEYWGGLQMLHLAVLYNRVGTFLGESGAGRAFNRYGGIFLKIPER